MSTTLHGQTFEPHAPKELGDALRDAFDYRGDVTITFQDNKTAEGYLYKVDPETDQITMFVPSENGESTPHSFPISTIRSISFTGEDTAFGKSWEDIMKHKAS